MFLGKGHATLAEYDADVPHTFWQAREEGTLTSQWDLGDFQWSGYDGTEPKPHVAGLKALGVTFLRSDIERVKPARAGSLRPAQKSSGRTVFIGHGHSEEWRKLAMFLQNDHGLSVLEFNSSSSVGVSTTERLQTMLKEADFAFLILTGEDEQVGGKFYPRLNVVHEAGLFQGKLGFEKAILLLEEGCEGFSNVGGLTHIAFPKAGIQTQFHEATRVLKREKLIS
jgi:predicted nucleotide-binding protein